MSLRGRVLWGGILVVCVFAFPWWAAAFVLAVGIVRFPWYAEAIVAALILDTLVWAPGNVWQMFPMTILVVPLVFLGQFIRMRLW